jgi:methyl-accepting chemotaxis protein
MKKGRNPRNFLVKQELQGRYIFTIFILVLVGCLLFSAMFASVSRDSMTLSYADNSLQIGNTPAILFKEILKTQWIFIIGGGAVIVLLAMVMSHRFAGPIYRFERTIKSMTEGDYSVRIHLRPKDDSHDLAELINSYNATLTADIKALKEAASHLRDQLNGISENPEESVIYEAFSTLHDIENKLRRYKVNY